MSLCSCMYAHRQYKRTHIHARTHRHALTHACIVQTQRRTSSGKTRNLFWWSRQEELLPTQDTWHPQAIANNKIRAHGGCTIENKVNKPRRRNSVTYCHPQYAGGYLILPSFSHIYLDTDHCSCKIDCLRSHFPSLFSIFYSLSSGI